MPSHSQTSFRLARIVLSASFVLANVLGYSLAESVTAPSAKKTDDLRDVKLSFAQLGSGPIELHGVQSIGSVNVGTRMDEVVVAARLTLRMTHSPSLLPELSHLRVMLNDQVLAALPLTRELAGREVEREVILDPRYFTDYNHIRFDLIGHYTNECENPQHSSLWANVSQHSELALTLRPLELRNDLALLPAPFFDRRDNRKLVMPAVLPAGASRAMVRSAGVAASWFGVLADYRSARFPVSFDSLPDRHAMVFATNDKPIQLLKLDDVDTPTIRLIDHPTNAAYKLLVFQGKDDQQLQQAVEGVVLGSPVLTGSSATVKHVKYQRRTAYDAPRWLRSDRPVKFAELVDSPAQLQVSGMSPPPVRLNLRLPPDLFTWNQEGVPLDLRYRYTAPNERDNSLLTVSLNNQLVRTYRLRPESESGSGGKLLLPLAQSAAGLQAEDLVLPGFQLASNNQLQFQFAIEHHRKGLCTNVFTDHTRESIDPDSTIDISQFPHYTAMPNLALFANAGYPFTRFADLAETAVVMSDVTDASQIEQLLFLLGRMGRHTGAVSVAYQLLNTDEAESADDLDLLILGGRSAHQLLTSWGQDVDLILNDASRTFRESASAASFAGERISARNDDYRPEISVSASGSLSAFMSFESPLSNARTIVALTGTDTGALNALLDVLEDDGKLPSIRGDLAIVRAGLVQSFQGDDVYYVGSLSWWQRLWFHISQHVVLLTLLSLTTLVIAAMLVYGWLQRRVARRLATQAP